MTGHIILPPNSKAIILSQGKIAIIDSDWYELINAIKWSFSYYGYAKSCTNTKAFKSSEFMHRLIMDAPKNTEVDHINGNKLDNRKCNLRLCTKQENGRNRRKGAGIFSSKYKGVTYCNDSKRTKPWATVINTNGKTMRIGRFLTEEEAATVYNEAALTYHGTFACLNQI